VLFICFALTVLVGKRQYFAWAGLWSAFFILAGTHFLNPDAFIARTNIALLQQGRQYDAYYNSTLSDDALPVLLGSFDSMNAADQRITVRRLLRRYCEHRDELDLRSWNYSRWYASRLINSNEDLVQEFRNCDSSVYYTPR